MIEVWFLTTTIQRIVRELRIWSRMKHENILPLFGVWTNFGEQNANYPVPVAPWMDDGDLFSYLQAHKELELADRLKIVSFSLFGSNSTSKLWQLCDVASAMAYCKFHSADIINHIIDLRRSAWQAAPRCPWGFEIGEREGPHNLRPDAHHINKINVLISNQRAYLTDFGISAILDEVSGQSSVVHANIRWAAPELIRQLTDKPQKPTCESDMYSFGCVVLEVSCRSREFIFG